MVPSELNLKQEERNWLDLPSDVTFNILNRIGMVDILENAQKVCTAWRKICKDPAMWRIINMNDLRRAISEVSADKLCKHAVDRSQGQLVDITIVSTSTYDAELHLYVADRYIKSAQTVLVHLCLYFVCIRSVCNDVLICVVS
ncbi:putative F-box domain-containing protein [Helianthus annuus]|uniref:F-box domain-containing protein n=1 Tax=Helianthus annuus TaxID=4232 RepID=A0A9K3EC04_HELAN|nr:putative F-box domain-containing protein [Helianthus annuus]KAJ0465636.1 putative F-box domain-containing protein [Helianthus annuus]KAJ0470506.1 putative F-box domain-containing protein [Helianthus annuus]KAJ0487229.1 putative F-box domain-containing protein [Helianthus annuus]KAJ0661343.1 putative F-box domain-containing protein [Helianthus annuus]